MKLIVLFMLYSYCLISAHTAFITDFFLRLHSLVDNIRSVVVPGTKAVDIIRHPVTTFGRISDLIVNKTIFPFIPKMHTVVPKIEYMLEHFPIVPGTKWCGRGNIADDENSTGTAKETDLCCREHDMCPDIIMAEDSKHGLINPGMYTRLNCKCDKRFYDCLRETSTTTAVATGVVYFSLLGPMCFQKTNPIIDCKQRIFNRCVTYNLDNTKDEEWQWFDNPIFS